METTTDDRLERLTKASQAMRLAYTTAEYVRDHGRSPSPSTMGSWAFQRSMSDRAYGSDLFGEIEWYHVSTLAEAKRAHRAAGFRGLWSVCP